MDAKKKSQQTQAGNKQWADGQSIAVLFCIFTLGSVSISRERKKQLHFQDHRVAKHTPTAWTDACAHRQTLRTTNTHRERKCWRIFDALVFNTSRIQRLPAFEWLIPAGGFVFLRSSLFNHHPMELLQPSSYPSFFQCIKRILFCDPWHSPQDLIYMKKEILIPTWGCHVRRISIFQMQFLPHQRTSGLSAYEIAITQSF